MRKGTEKDWLGSEFTSKNCKKHEKQDCVRDLQLQVEVKTIW